MNRTAMEGILNGDWLETAACRNLPPGTVDTVRNLTGQHQADPEQVMPAVFFPTHTTSNQHATSPVRRVAAALCASCPVADKCLVASLARCEKYGTWGGLTERDRRVLRHNLHAAGVLFRFETCAYCFEAFHLGPKRHWGRFCGEECARLAGADPRGGTRRSGLRARRTKAVAA